MKKMTVVASSFIVVYVVAVKLTLVRTISICIIFEICCVVREMEWSEDQQFDLIREVRARPVIWDPRNQLKKKKNKKDDAFKEIAAIPIFEGRTFDELKKKYNSLCQSYRSYRRKAMRKPSGMSTSTVYKPTWVFFGELDAFLKDTYEPKGATDAVSNPMFSSFIIMYLETKYKLFFRHKTKTKKNLVTTFFSSSL